MKDTNERLKEANTVSFEGKITTIPELLVKTRGNQTEAARVLGTNRCTIRKYCRDVGAIGHVIVNGVLMISRGSTGEHMRRRANAATS
ncbi:phage NinH family protein [Erwinia phyllosphaerae]|uniref:phage NinH family protein n=1 Tax=Erwinia phyllosphaerae TaxID=2853256 RepID=UPI001FEFD45F|nr:phage NinH family protein [Erwinia phyllosphaerae]MBV4365893.1 phage NinH family protein [Erwinia phyllosphaerae]